MAKLYILAICIACMSLIACSSPGQPCLTKGESGRILDMQPTPQPSTRNQAEHDEEVTILLTTDNRTVRVCRAFASDLTILHKGQVIVGYNNKPQVQWPYLNWYRIG